MKDKSIKVLEFNKVKDILKKYAITKTAKSLIEDLKPYASLYEVKNALEESNEALDILIRKGSPPFEGYFDTSEGLERANKGGVLSLEQLIRVGNMLKCSRKFKEYLSRKDEEVSYKHLEDLAYVLTPVKSLEDSIFNAIISEDEISDRASATLFSLRKTLKEKNSSVREKLNHIVKQNSKYLQDSLYTMRGDRYVLPVKAEYKGTLQGLVHDQSSSGATLFIEPISLLNLNNEIRELKLKEKAEIERILLELSEKVKLNIEECFNNANILTKLDLIFAKGKYASSLNAIMPTVNENKSFNILGAKHPLIDKKVVVPSDIYLGDKFTTLMITGPNTGGKTVTLKTVGLIHLMGLSGLLIPAEENSSIAFFEDIFADIGDEQSIEQSLSTFSSHMTNIVSILEHANKNSLILFDEIGSGTDPVEGAALAISIIETLKDRGCRIIGTTHYTELKGYALKTELVENASVEFDVESLKPTYKLFIGIPGKSNAFDISKRLGLKNDVILKAKEYISEENMQFEDLIKELQEKSILANKNEREAKKLKIEAQAIKDKYSEKVKKLDSVRDKIYEEARLQAREIVSTAKDESDEILKAMRELEKLGIAQGGRTRLEEERKKLKDNLEKKEKEMQKKKENKGEMLTKVNLGEEAFLPSLNQKVIVISMPDNKGEVLVEAGIMKISVKLKDLRKVENTQVKKEKKKRELKLNLKTVESKIDLRGMDAEEACYRTDKYLDEAYLGNLGEVTIVHGKGTGVLRKAITDMLKRHTHVKSYRLGVYGEGGDGVTLVELK